MESSEVSNQLLKNKYNLHNAPEVDVATKRHQAHTGESAPQDPLARIGMYLNRFHEITDREDPQDREHGMDAMKRLLYRNYVIKPQDIPQSYWENQRRIIRERGQGADLEQVDFDELKRQNTEAVIADQRSSLDTWIDYLSSSDAEASYPDAARYWAFREMLQLSRYDKANKRFRSRLDDDGKTSPFPDLNREALAVAIDAVVKRVANAPDYDSLELKTRQMKNRIKALSGQVRGGNTSLESELKEAQQQLETLRKDEDTLLGFATMFSTHEDETDEAKKTRLDSRRQLHQQTENADFASLYAWAIEKVTPATEEDISATKGEWIKYEQGTDHMPLVSSLQGHGTGWCTAGEATARMQLDGGNFYVYYSYDKDGKATIPRVAIRMEGDTIGEVRGIAPEQNLDGGVVSVVDEKLKEFPDGEIYQKKVSDMQHLTQIEYALQEGKSLGRDDLAFLYELDNPIQGFGYSRDPRIAELRSQRNPEEDMPLVFGCEKSQIAHNATGIQPDTKAYVGSLVPGIFDRLQNIEHVYTSFPEGKIRRQSIEIGGKTTEQLQAELTQAGIKISSYAQDMLKSPDFTTLPHHEMLDTIRLKVQDLGFTDDYPTTDQLYQRANDLGLELCPAEAAPHYRLQYADQPIGEWVNIGMKQITDRNGDPSVFNLARDEGGLWLDDPWARSDSRWRHEGEFVFSLRKKTQNP